MQAWRRVALLAVYLACVVAAAQTAEEVCDDDDASLLQAAEKQGRSLAGAAQSWGCTEDLGPGGHAQTAVVLKTFGNWTPWVDWLAERYGRQLANTGVQFAVLRDVTKVMPSQDTVRSTAQAFGNITVPLCEVSWSAAREALSAKIFQGRDDDSHILTTVFELLWWKRCAPKLPLKDVQFVWFVEHDAFFNGDAARFVRAFGRSDADLMARGFRIAGRRWWLYGRLRFGLENGLRTFGLEDDLVQNVHPLPEISEGKCRQDIENNTHGLLFAQDHITRYSARFFRMLERAAELGIAGPGEAFKPSLCASGIGLRSGEACSMRDFAPLREPEGAGWISPVYCWVQVRPEPGREAEWSGRDLPCTPRWRDKWVHPVKLSSPGLRLTEC